MTNPKPTLKDSAIEGWEKEFDNEFYIPCKSYCSSEEDFISKCDCDTPELIKSIKSFISDLLAKEKMELVEQFIEWAHQRMVTGRLTKKKGIQNQELTLAIGKLKLLKLEKEEEVGEGCKHEKYIGGVCVKCDYVAFSDLDPKEKEEDNG